VGLVGGPNGDVYVTEAFAGQVSKVKSNGEKAVLAKDLKIPEGIALMPDGKLVVAEVCAKRIVELDPQTGKLNEIAGNLPIGLVGAPVPTGVGVGATGSIYFSSNIENAIYKVTKK
jgi:streptogramin lyase